MRVGNHAPPKNPLARRFPGPLAWLPHRYRYATGVDATVVTGDGVEAVADRTFDRVLCSPPTHAGSGAFAGLFDGVREVLAADGHATFVHHRGLDLDRHLDRFGDARTVRTGEEHVVRRAVA